MQTLAVVVLFSVATAVAVLLYATGRAHATDNNATTQNRLGLPFDSILSSEFGASSSNMAPPQQPSAAPVADSNVLASGTSQDMPWSEREKQMMATISQLTAAFRQLQSELKKCELSLGKCGFKRSMWKGSSSRLPRWRWKRLKRPEQPARTGFPRFHNSPKIVSKIINMISEMDRALTSLLEGLCYQVRLSPDS